MSGLAELVHKCKADPLAGRRELHAALLRSPTYVLHLGDCPLAKGEVRVLRGKQSFSLWADIDPELEGVWVPAFSSRKALSTFIAARALKPPEGREFQWMCHDPGKVYPILQSIGRFAGILLDPLAGQTGLRLDWSDVNALSEGRLPAEAPTIHELPVEEYRVPEGIHCLFTETDARLGGLEGRQVLFSEAGRPSQEDFRRMARLGLAGEGKVWVPCRHLVGALRLFALRADEAPHLELLMKALMEFEMYGEAEAFCVRMGEADGRQCYALAWLSSLYRRAGKLDQCIEACRRGIREHPEERMFYVNQALAHAQMEDMAAAREVARLGLRGFPEDADLQRFL